MTVNKKSIKTTGFDADALATFTNGDTIDNRGQLTTSGELANGIFALADDVTVLNSGRISTAGLGAQGIFVVGNGATVSNSGSIRTTGEPTEDGSLTSDGINVFGNAAHVVNTGTIVTAGAITSAIFTVGDVGLLENRGAVSSSGDFGSIVAAAGAGNSLINSGTIQSSGIFSTGMATFGPRNALANSGTILMTGGVYTSAMWIFGSFSTMENKGLLRLTGAPDGAAILVVGGDHMEAVNTGRVETLNEASIGMGASGHLGGLDIRLINQGVVETFAVGSVGILHGAPFAEIVLGHPNDDHRPWQLTDEGLVVNSGSIVTHGNGAPAILTAGYGQVIVNQGAIETFGGAATRSGFYGALGPLSSSGIIATGDDVIVFNGAGGSIIAHAAAVPAVQLNVVEGADPEVGGDSTLLNQGTISGTLVAIAGGGSEETVVNQGYIHGEVRLGGGDDVYVAGAGGRLDGILLTGAGRDLVAIGNGSGVTTIGDFAAGKGAGDVLDLAAFGFANVAGVLAASQQVGGSVRIALDGDDALVLQNVTLAALHADDFHFNSPANPPWLPPELLQVMSEYG